MFLGIEYPMWFVIGFVVVVGSVVYVMGLRDLRRRNGG